jgi:molybdenum cofactor synthesis domain-containing protein
MSKITATIITISDRSSAGARPDKSGPALIQYLKDHNFDLVEYLIISDDLQKIQDTLISACQNLPNIIFTTGGTGFAGRDNTPEATKAVLNKETPGISEYLRFKSMQITPHAILSRATSGIRNETLIINLPGSPKAVIESITFLLPVLSHAVELIKNSPNSENNH